MKDESAAYLEFLQEEVGPFIFNNRYLLTLAQAQKFSAATADDDEMEEESMLDSPLDKVEPYGLFKSSLMSTFSLPLSPLPWDYQVPF